ncbi:MAG: nitrate reductase molybdenum cofactor assembly chaperone [Gammaproteobacteria bacterium]|nr:nitrate reductase molybdenum cofactor assembly chaperone [Gammaproteobacteria bacterium]MCW8840381.1 nitrate reductase molybdenum cofactor assembly chaperone [Gammaproteobacteria bacterium]MCW8927299.1 nitrate reductase molybdenum cofactor assembly chaperone [Gammaproteobacteria bacterium]MCW8958168.1 nitrate reductase molybdenum cofactor assembly chaperone [Gammaproteobacteria bacterium]MCW8973157.1 nitrate reductase molybdenum cofactor assembly chaperone [Gammaproteobacteria bacterium]
MSIYKILSALLDYPNQELVEHLPEIRAEIDGSQNIEKEEKEALYKFLDHLTSMPLTEQQADYVKTFDMTPEHSLHLTHHLFGDDNDRNRGPALIDLAGLYQDYGIEVATNELPDFLPLILEFTSLLEEKEATMFLSDAHKVLALLADNLTKAGSPYAALLSIVKSRATLTRLAA